MSFQRSSVTFLPVVCTSVCPCFYVVWLTVGIICKTEKQMTWHKLTNPFLSLSASQLYACKHTHFHLCVINVPPVSPLHLRVSLPHILFSHTLLHLSHLFLYTLLPPFLTCFSSSTFSAFVPIFSTSSCLSLLSHPPSTSSSTSSYHFETSLRPCATSLHLFSQ